jgi:PAS domain S-box-containing protein
MAMQHTSQSQPALRKRLGRDQELESLPIDILSSDRQYQVLAESLPTIVWTGRPDGYVDYYNQRWYDYTGLTWEESDRYGASLVMSAQDYALTVRKWNHAVTTGEPYEIEYKIRRASDRMCRWHLGRAIPLLDATGKILKWCGTCTDIHDQKMAQEQIARINEELEERVMERTRELEKAREKDQANYARLHSVIDSMVWGAVLCDEDTIALQVNNRFCQLFNVSHEPSDLIGKSGEEIVQLIVPFIQNPDFARQQLLDALQAGVPQTAVEVLLKDGRVLSRDYLPITVNGYSRGHLLLYRDITREKRLDSSKSEFMSLASHQLRTPLTAIRWALGRLDKQSSTMGQKEQDLITAAKQASVHMAETITTMLAISRIEAGTMQLDYTNLPLRTVLDDVASQYRDEYLRRSLNFTIDCAPDVVLRTDKHLLREILSNLLSNSIKYTPQGGSVEVRVGMRDTAVLIFVVDTGFGIPSYQQEKIFTKFFRGDNVIQMHTDGTGLGLYLVYHLVKMLGGTIAFDSQEGQGTVFTMTFPK